MERDARGYVKMDDRDYATLVEMTNRFKDKYHTPKKDKKKKSEK